MSFQCKEEIERKFLIRAFPEHLTPFEMGVVYQGYLIANDKEELRLREQIPHRSDVSIYTICHKTSGTLSRTETDQEIAKPIYDCLITFLESRQMIKKEYQHYKFGGHIIECNRVDGYWMYCEVEFESEQDAHDFIKPDWFGMEVTNDDVYKMNQYWIMSRGKTV